MGWLNERLFIKNAKKYSNKKYIPVYIIITIAVFYSHWNMHDFKPNSDNATVRQFRSDNAIIAITPSYWIEEHELNIETVNMHIDIRYPRVCSYVSDTSQSELIIDAQKQKNINELLTPPEIQTLFKMILHGLVRISDTGELIYDFPPHDYHLGIDHSYTMGFANNNLLNVYKRSISYTRNSDWSYGALLIDMKLGKAIKPIDFFDVRAFKNHVESGNFKANYTDFDIQSFFKNVGEDQLIWYLKDIFINQNKQVEVILIYGEGPEITLNADLNTVKDMIKLQYLEYLDGN